MNNTQRQSRTKLLRLACASWLLFSMCFWSGCETTENPLTTRQQIELELQNNNYTEALSLAEAELAKKDSSEMHLLAGLASFGVFIDQMNFVTTLVFALVGDLDVIADVQDDDISTAASVVDENAFLIDLFQNLMHYLATPVAQSVEHLLQVSADSQTEIKDFQVRFWQVDFADFSGTWLQKDAHILAGLLGPIASGFLYLESIDLGFDAYYAVHRIIGRDSASAAPEYTNLVVNLLEAPDYPNFLKLTSTSAPLLKQAHSILRDSSAAFAKHAASDSQKGIFELYEEDDVRFLALVNRVRMDKDGVFDLSFRVRDDTDFGTLQIPLPDSWINAAKDIVEHLDGQAGNQPMLTIEKHALPPLVSVALGLVRHIELTDTISSALDVVGDNPDLAIQVVDDFLPDGLYFDAESWLLGQGKPRDAIPLYRTDLSERQNNFLFSWECDKLFVPTVTDPVGSTGIFPGGLGCASKKDEGFEALPSSTFKIKDSAHFASVTYTTNGIATIAKDGYETSWPIVPFEDASWGGLIYLDAKIVDASPDEPSGIHKANNRTFNAWLGALYDDIGGLLD